MAEHIWSVLCDDAVIDARTKKVSLHSVVERLTIADFDKKLRAFTKKDNVAAATRLWLVSWWERSNPEKAEIFDTRVVVRSPGGERIFNADDAIAVDLEKATRGRVFTQIPGLPLRGAGSYKILVESKAPSGKWRRVARLPLDVQFADSPTDMQAALGLTPAATEE